MKPNLTKQSMWRSVPIKGFEHYLVSECGQVFNMRRMAVVKGWYNCQGYQRVSLRDGKNRKDHYVHRLVAMAFSPPENDIYEVHHKNGVRADNRKTNLEWITRAENMAHVHAQEEDSEMPDIDETPF